MPKPKDIPRRSVLKDGARGVMMLMAGGAAGYLGSKVQAEEYVWQIDPNQCTMCGKCSTTCVLDESAVKCIQKYEMCGYCKLCTGFFDPAPIALDTGAENQICPTNAIKRSFVEDPYFEYRIDESLCIGCAKCVKWCKAFGNASMYLQIKHDRCVNCNECSIAADCPSQAIKRIPLKQAYLLKGEETGE